MANTTKIENSTETVSQTISFDGDHIEIKKWVILDHDKSDSGIGPEFRYSITVNGEVQFDDLETDELIEHLLGMAAH